MNKAIITATHRTAYSQVDLVELTP